MKNMNFLDEMVIVNKSHRELREKAEKLAEKFAERAAKNDQESSFPFENFSDLKTEGFLKLTVPKKYGGNEISLYEFLLVQEKIAEGDGATGLSLGWHNGIVMDLSESKKWDERTFERICEEIVAEGKLINSCASEPAAGSPARGGKPKTTARKEGSSWIINGHKSFTSLAPILDYFIVTATIEETGEVGEYLVPKGAEGLSIKETWDTIGMRATRSDDLLLHNVKVEKDALVSIRQATFSPSTPKGWLLHIPACYLGIAIAARNFAVKYAKEYQPASLSHPISELSEVRRKTAEMDLELTSARHFMYSVAKKWDEQPHLHEQMGHELAAVKYVATNSAIKVVDLAMRIAGGQSLRKEYPLERYYRDVRCGLHNPPADDITLKIFGDRAFQE